MPHLNIFTDGSVNTQLKFGCGACFILSNLETPIELIKDKVKVKRFDDTSSTKLELQTLLWALSEVLELYDSDNISVTIYTDSQNIIGLPSRRSRLEENNYFSAKGRKLNNYELYQKFYFLTSKLNCEFIKVIGHQASHKKNDIDRLFSLVDKASRNALRRA